MTPPSAKLIAAIGKWLPRLDKVEGWREWKRQSISITMRYDDDWIEDISQQDDFDFPPELNRQHAVVMSYLVLNSTLASLRDCEYYFRRYPFSGLPIQKHNHLLYICEMYFGRFYEFKERMKQCVAAINEDRPVSNQMGGSLIKAFGKEFDREIRARNGVHHHTPFEDISIDNLLLSSVMRNQGKSWGQRYDSAYRRASREWATRVASRSKVVEKYLDAIAQTILDSCDFLTIPK